MVLLLFCFVTLNTNDFEDFILNLRLRLSLSFVELFARNSVGFV